jgi:DNA polymerase III subunit delta'
MAFSVEEALQYLLGAHRHQRMAHTFLFSGPEGAGKNKLAQELFKALNGLPNALGHPDFHRIEPESKSRRILVEQIRELEASLRLHSRQAAWKFGVINDADRLMPQAGNAFLKTLEEPPEHSVLILVTALPAALLDTIRSRCIQVPLRESGTRQLEPEAIQLLDAVSEFFEARDFSVAGALGLARQLHESLTAVRLRIAEEHEALLKREQEIYRQTTDGKWLDDLSERLSALTESRYVKTRASLVMRLIEWFGDIIRQQHNSIHLDLPHYRAKTERSAGEIALPELLNRIRALESLQEQFSRNVQESLAIDVAFLKAFGPGGLE